MSIAAIQQQELVILVDLWTIHDSVLVAPHLRAPTSKYTHRIAEDLI